MNQKMSHYFTEKERETLQKIMQQRRDVRGNKFVDTPISDEIIYQILQVAELSPSVGFSQPWEFVIVRDVYVYVVRDFCMEVFCKL